MTNIKTFSAFNESKDIEQVGRLSDIVLEKLNEQIGNELMSAQIYFGKACWSDDKGWRGASQYFFKSANEEISHMNKIYNYIFERNCLAKVPVVSVVKQDFLDMREVLELALDHEIAVTAMWNDISEIAKEEGDNTTYAFAQWFLNEQVEEESKFRDLLFKLNLDMPKYELDELFEELIKA